MRQHCQTLTHTRQRRGEIGSEDSRHTYADGGGSGGDSRIHSCDFFVVCRRVHRTNGNIITTTTTSVRVVLILTLLWYCCSTRTSFAADTWWASSALGTTTIARGYRSLSRFASLVADFSPLSPSVSQYHEIKHVSLSFFIFTTLTRFIF